MLRILLIIACSSLCLAIVLPDPVTTIITINELIGKFKIGDNPFIGRLFGGESNVDERSWSLDDVPCWKRDSEKGVGRGHNFHTRLSCCGVEVHAKGKEDWEDLWNENYGKMRVKQEFQNCKNNLNAAKCNEKYKSLKEFVKELDVENTCMQVAKQKSDVSACAPQGFQNWVEKYCPQDCTW